MILGQKRLGSVVVGAQGRHVARRTMIPRQFGHPAVGTHAKYYYFSTTKTEISNKDDPKSSPSANKKADAAAAKTTATDHWAEDNIIGYSGHNFPDFIEHWNRDNFRRVGYLLGGSTGVLAAMAAATVTSTLVVPTVVLGVVTGTYWRIGLRDMQQTSHAIRRNYPVLGNMRYIFETVRIFFFHLCGLK